MTGDALLYALLHPARVLLPLVAVSAATLTVARVLLDRCEAEDLLFEERA